MKIMVISKKTLIWAATVLLVIVAAIAFAVFSGRDSGAEPDRPTGGKPQSNLNLPGSAAGSGVEQYELEVLAGLMKELPVYSVSRSDKRIALTIDAAWEDDKTDFILDTPEGIRHQGNFFPLRFLGERLPRQGEGNFRCRSRNRQSLPHPSAHEQTFARANEK